MGTGLVLIQSLQETYAANTKLSLLLLDKNGRIVTKPSNVNPLVGLILKYYHSNFEHIADEFSFIEKGIIYDGLFGLKQLLVPVFSTNGKLTYYIWGGLLIEQGTKVHIEKSFESIVDQSVKWIEAIQSIEESSCSSKEHCLQQLEQMAEICSAILKRDEIDIESNKKFELLNEDSITNDSELIDRLFLACTELDFVGMAQYRGNGQFKVKHFKEQNNWELISTTFSMGEGFLGQAAAKGKITYWSDIQTDPRASLFLQGDESPNCLFCVPIYENKKIKSIIFGGSYHQSIAPKTKSLIETIKRILELTNANQQLMTSKDNLLIRLTTLLEVSQVLTEFQDQKRILFTLVDMSMNLVQGPFSCAILKNEDGKVNVVSRGLTSDHFQTYGKSVSDRYFVEDLLDTALPNSNVYLTDWDVKVLEFPIYYRDKLYGVLCVGMEKSDDLVELQTLISSLVLMGASALHHHKLLNLDKMENKLVKSLHVSMKQWNPKGYEQVVEVEKLATSFTKSLGYAEDEILDISSASLLAFYDPIILADSGIDEKIIKLVKEYQMQKATSSKVEILLMVNQYLQSSSIGDVDYNYALKKQFEDYISKTQVIEEDLILTPKTKNTAERVTDILDSFKKEKLLTSREVDVLRLIIQGRNNRDIADQLYISEHTVKNHVTNIFQKLDVQDRTQAITFVYQGGQKLI